MRAFFREHFHLLKHAGLAVLLLQITTTAMDQWINGRLETLMNSAEGPGFAFWMTALASVVNSLVFPLFITLFWLAALASYRRPRPIALFVAENANQLAIETLRTWGSALTWGLLFILPAFLRLFALSFVPYVVTLSKKYRDGEVDALKTSTHMVGRHWFGVSMVLLFFSTLIPIALASGLDEFRDFHQHPGAAALLCVIDVLISAIAAQLLFRFFEKALTEDHDELVLHLEGN